MKIISSQSHAAATDVLVSELLAPLKAIEAAPSLLISWANYECINEKLVRALKGRSSKVMLASSCRGVMTDDGVSKGAGLLAFYDAQGAYGLGSRAVGENARESGYLALQAAVQDSGRDWQSPDVVWCSLPPSQEEDIIEGMRDLVGDATPIIGGSMADNDVVGDWLQLSGDTLVNDHIVVLALYPSGGVGVSFSSGYSPTGITALVTKAEGREVLELDGQPAAEVYKRWTNDPSPVVDEVIMAKSTYSAFGRVISRQDGIDQYLMSHLAQVTQRGGLVSLSKIVEDDTVHLMSGSPETLVERGARVIDNAEKLLPVGHRSAGAIMVYCAGCMLALEDDIHRVASTIGERFHAPYLGAFTFGEQGCFSDRSNRHGNLMISAVVFGEKDGNH